MRRNIWWIFFMCLFCRDEADKNAPFTRCQPIRSALRGSSFRRLLHTVKSLYKVQWPARCLEVIPWLCVTMETRVQKWNRSIMFSNTVHWEKGMAWRTNTEHSGGRVSARAAALCLHHHPETSTHVSVRCASMCIITKGWKWTKCSQCKMVRQLHQSKQSC